MAKNITLILPGIVPAFLTKEECNAQPAFKKIISRSTRKSILPSQEAYLSHYFKGLEGKVSYAAWEALAHGLISDETANKAWCRVDFIDCEVDHQTAYVTASQARREKEEENEALLAIFRPFFAQEGHTLYVSAQGEWYVALGHSEEITAVDPLSMIGKSLGDYLPTGPCQAYWHRLLTQTQMLLAMHQQRGFSSLWFSGIGRLCTPSHTILSALCTQEAFLLGLATSLELKTFFLTTEAEVLFGEENKNVLIFDRTFYHHVQYQDQAAWWSYLTWWEKQWFLPLLKRLASGKIKKLSLYDGHHWEYTLTPLSLLFFWKKMKIT